MQLADVLGKRSNNSRRVLAGGLDEHREAGIALDEGGDVRVVRSGKTSQCPGTARSSISAGRSRMEIISRICPCPLFALWGSGRRIRRAVRNCAVSSFFSTPRVRCGSPRVVRARTVVMAGIGRPPIAPSPAATHCGQLGSPQQKANDAGSAGCPASLRRALSIERRGIRWCKRSLAGRRTRQEHQRPARTYNPAS
jgi:hypothetical protein